LPIICSAENTFLLIPASFSLFVPFYTNITSGPLFGGQAKTIATNLVRYIGGISKSGRKRETITALAWNPPYLGSQKYLLPDVVIERENETIIIDAKYKEHLEELQVTQWAMLDEEIREWHRNDLLQVLAYSTIYDSKRIVSCLIYPCRKATWISLKNRNRLFYQASIYAGKREVNLLMTALPIDADINEVVIPLVEVFKGKHDMLPQPLN
jgi:hypothetical protein